MGTAGGGPARDRQRDVSWHTEAALSDRSSRAEVSRRLGEAPSQRAARAASGVHEAPPRQLLLLPPRAPAHRPASAHPRGGSGTIYERHRLRLVARAAAAM